MKNNFEDYQLYQRCKICGQILTEDEIWDNDSHCDFCYNDIHTWTESPFGDNKNEE